MFGLGETDVEIRRTMADIREQGVDILAVGQYLSSSGKEIGLRHTESGPLVRSLYKASKQSENLIPDLKYG